MAKPVKCERCGRENDQSLQLCLDCGRPLRPAAPPPAPAPAPGPAPSGGASGFRLSSVRVDGLPGATFPLEPGETVFGRTDGGIRIPNDGTISPRHACFTVRDGGLVVEDMGSLNGTYVRIQGPRRIALGAEFRVGRQLLRVEPLPRPAAPEGSARTWGARDPGCRFRVAQLLEGGGVGEIHPLREGENTVGREAGDVTFPGDRYVSGRHARLEVSGDDVTLADLGSSNGTFVRIAVPTPLAPGDQLLVGTQLLRVDGSTGLDGSAGSAPAP